ncbi:hypothetical protein [Dissulfurimicrobium hydrothermale]|uniref:hypothetical protein n=1 Tax=Dissulfurimicrobium hydrothermale TaxID=1750598 RepID=UPI001EDB61A7|nr:hypothetical protein [Dissulfurimicrobium hydrothermale]UKL13751.1 hypothetical protein LGS26_00240 [Dissulfurimicrobium hydrothermale]
MEFEQIGALVVLAPKQVGTKVAPVPVPEQTGAVFVPVVQIGVLLTNGSFVKSIPTVNVAGWPGVTVVQVPGLTVIHGSLVDARIHSVCVVLVVVDDVAVVEKTLKVTGLGFDSCSFAM